MQVRSLSNKSPTSILEWPFNPNWRLLGIAFCDKSFTGLQVYPYPPCVSQLPTWLPRYQKFAKLSVVRLKSRVDGTTSPIFGPAPYRAVRRSMRRRTAP